MKRTFPRLFAWVFVICLVLDQAIKFWARWRFEPYEQPGMPWPGVFEFTLTYNKGIAFGMFQGFGIIFAPIAILITVLCARYCFMHPDESRATHFGLGLLSSGAIGNLIDRVFLGKVTDMFALRIFEFPVFNFADSCITVAAFILGIRFLFDGRKQTVTAPVETSTEGQG